LKLITIFLSRLIRNIKINKNYNIMLERNLVLNNVDNIVLNVINIVKKRLK